jgi:hypothetical protein
MLSLYAELTGPSGTARRTHDPLGGRHTLMAGIAVAHSVPSLPHLATGHRSFYVAGLGEGGIPSSPGVRQAGER